MSRTIVGNLKTKLAGMRTLSTAARDEMADKLFFTETVTHQMTVAASAGYDRVTISPTTPVDLRETPAAKQTTALLRQAGFEVEWQKRQLRPGDAEFWVMMVSWQRPS